MLLVAIYTSLRYKIACRLLKVCVLLIQLRMCTWTRALGHKLRVSAASSSSVSLRDQFWLSRAWAWWTLHALSWVGRHYSIWLLLLVMLLVGFLSFGFVHIDTILLLIHVFLLDCLRGMLLTHSRPIVLIPYSRNVLKCRHHLGIGIVKCLQLRVIVLFAGCFKPISHTLLLLLGQVMVLVNHWVGSLVEFCTLCRGLIIDWIITC